MNITGRERMRTVLEGEIPDRVPYYPTIYVDHACVACGKSFEDALIDPAVGLECMLGAARRYETDTVRFLIGPDLSWYEEKSVVESDGKLIQIDRKSGKSDGSFDVAGGGKLMPFDPPDYVKDMRDIDSIEVMKAEEYLQRGCFRDVKANTEVAHDEGFFVIGMCSSQTLNFMVQKMGNTAAALFLYYDNPKMAFALMDKALAISVEKANAYKQSGVDGLMIGDSYASASVISPEIYRRFSVPIYTLMAQELRRMGIYSILHCCGNYDPLLDTLPEMGIDAMDGIDPSSGMSVKYTKERIGTRLTLNGGINCLTLLNGSSDDVEAEAVQCIEDGMDGGRFSLGSACAVPRYTPPENMITVKRAVLEHGVYVP